jgi:hypothetical protein
MPIKPENRARYPKDWKAIRAEVMERAGNKCEWPDCRVTHGEWGLRALNGVWYRWDQFAEGVEVDGVEFEREGQEPRAAYRIVLTIAHLDHMPENNGEPSNRPNLRAWCQYHHLRYDHAHHMENARITRNKNRGQEVMPIFDAPIDQPQHLESA